MYQFFIKLIFIIIFSFIVLFAQDNKKNKILLSGPLVGIGLTPSNSTVVEGGQNVDQVSVGLYSILGYAINYNIQANLNFNPVLQTSLLFRKLEQQRFDFESSFLIGVNIYRFFEMAFGISIATDLISFTSNLSFYFDDSKKVYYPITFSFSFNNRESYFHFLFGALWF